MTTQPEMMAPGHVYLPKQGTGIEWKPGEATLHIRGQAPITAKHQTETAWDFWYNLAFLEVFPQATHWWFRSIWTGRVRVFSPEPQPLSPGTVYGFMEWSTADSERAMYTVTEANPVVIDAPYPPNEMQPANVPLRVKLGRIVAGLMQAEVEPGQWYGVSSLTPAAELRQALPDTLADEQRIYGNWRLAYGEGMTPYTLRETLCRTMGLSPAE